MQSPNRTKIWRFVAIILVIGGFYWIWKQKTQIHEQHKTIDELRSKVASSVDNMDLQQKSAASKGLQALAIESKGLAEFDPENDTIEDVSSQDKEIMKDMAPILQKAGNLTDKAQIKEAIVGLSKVIGKYPSYPDAYLLRALLSVVAENRDYQNILSDIDNFIKFHLANKYTSAYPFTGGAYSLRSKVDILSNNYAQAIEDLQKAVEIAVRTDGSAADVFNTGGVKPEDESNRAAIQKGDLDLLVRKYPNEYRTYMFRGCFYKYFTTFDEKYYPLAIGELERARKLNSRSAFVEYLLGSIYETSGFWTKAAWADISDSGGFRDKVNSLALQHFKAATNLDPAFGEAYAQAASELYGLKRYSEAIPYYDKVIEIDPNNAGVYNDRGLAKTNTGDYYSAINDFSKAIQLRGSKRKRPRDDFSTRQSHAYENRAAAYVKVMDYDSAVKDYSSAIGLKFGPMVIMMSIPAIRSIYPELSDRLR
jgi:tetratricopeptide (TPR) repeat protein